MDEFVGDERAVSESAGVAILVGITILVTATVGLNVLVAEDDGPDRPGANFSYDHVSSGGTLIITHVEGDEFPASELVIEGENAETTWSETANVPESEAIGPGDRTQISGENSYGQSVTQSDTIRIVHERGENRTQLSEWP